MNVIAFNIRPYAVHLLLSLAAAYFSYSANAQCDRTILAAGVFGLTVAPGETVCTVNDLFIGGNLNIGTGGRLVVAPGSRVRVVSVISNGVIDMGTSSFMFIQNTATFSGASSVTNVGNSARMFACQSATFNMGATLSLGQMSVFDSFNISFSGGTNYVSYTGLPGGTPRGFLVSRTSMTLDAVLGNSNMLGYCATTPGSVLTPAQLGSMQSYCTPLIPPEVYASNLCGVVGPFYFENALLSASFHFFTVERLNSKIARLSWAVTNEDNVVRFEIQRASSDSSYTTIGEVMTAADSTIPRTYVFLDSNHYERTGTTVYRIRAIASFGGSLYSTVARITFRNQRPAPVLFPNPVKQSFSIRLPQEIGRSGRLEVFTWDGRTIYSGSVLVVDSHVEVSSRIVSSLQRGHYYVRLRVGERTYTAHFVK
jgi:hypothetical protein